MGGGAPRLDLPTEGHKGADVAWREPACLYWFGGSGCPVHVYPNVSCCPCTPCSFNATMLALSCLYHPNSKYKEDIQRERVRKERGKVRLTSLYLLSMSPGTWAPAMDDTANVERLGYSASPCSTTYWIGCYLLSESRFTSATCRRNIIITLLHVRDII